MRVELQFETPLIVGDKRLSTNYIATKDYIQGSVIRAAFARVILNHCMAYHGEVEEVSIIGKDGKKQIVKKRNWIHCRGEEKTEYEKVCKACPYHDVCAHFSNIRFSFFYPKATSVIPLTSMVCKNKPKEHGFIDSLTAEHRICKVCKQRDPDNARVEFTSGLRNKDGVYKAEKVIQTKTSINPYTCTSKDGMLYNLTSLSPITFEGEIEGIDEGQMTKLFKTLRIGAYTSTGFGKCIVKADTKHKPIPTWQQVEKYSTQYKEHLQRDVVSRTKEQQEEQKEYMALLLIADAHMNVQVPKGYCTTAQYKEIWEKSIDLPKGKIHHIYFDTELYRGYDTSSATEDYRAKTKFQINKGSVLVIELQDKKELQEAYETYGVVEQGKQFFMGEECENGFGQIEIYCGEVDTYGAN